MAMNSTPNSCQSQKEKSVSASVYLQDSGEVQKVFEQFDGNGNSQISVAELGDVLKALCMAVLVKDLQRVMDDLDSDHDSFISMAELAAFCRCSVDDGGSSELHDAFDLYDQDHNGLISAAKLRDVLCRLGNSVTVDDYHRMIASIDADGNVNFEEFRTMMHLIQGMNASDPTHQLSTRGPHAHLRENRLHDGLILLSFCVSHDWL